MKRFQRILVGIDLDAEDGAVTVGSRRAALQARWLAERTGAALTFLHSTWADLFEDADRIRPGLGPEALQAFHDLQREYDAEDVPVEAVLTEDRAWVEAIRRVQRGENDLVIVARRNAPGTNLFGSTSRKLIRKCPCPVWVVRPDSELALQVVVAATDLGAVGDLAVELGAHVAEAHEGELHVVHAWQVPMAVQLAARRESDAAQQAALEEIQRACEEHIRAALAATEARIEPHLHVGCDAPSRSIARAVEGLDADLLVMGTLSRSGVAGLLVGNTAERILEKVDCSILTIKPEDFVSPVTPRGGSDG